MDKLIDDMSVSVTGARKGDTLKGIKACNKDVSIRVLENIPPYRKHIKQVRESKELWSVYLSKLSTITNFRDMNLGERSEYILSSSDNVSMILDFPVQLLSTGKDTSQIFTLSEDRLDGILKIAEDSNREDLLKELDLSFREQWEESDNNKNYRQTFFESSGWKIDTSYTLSKSFNGTLVDVNDHKVYSSRYNINNEDRVGYYGVYIFKISQIDIGFICPEDSNKGKPWSSNDLSYFLEKLDLYVSKEDIELVNSALEIYTPTMLISTMEACITYGANKCLISYNYKTGDKIEHYIPNGIFSVIVWFKLFLSDGYFNPAIQRFVKGKEISFERLASCILRESNVNVSSLMVITSLGWLHQKISDFKACESHILLSMQSLIHAVESPKVFDKSGGNIIYNYNTDMTMWDIIIKNLSIIGAENIKTSENVVKGNRYTRPSYMEMEHGINHNCCPNLVYFIPLEEFRSHRNVKSSKVAENIFKDENEKLISINYRVGKIIDFSDNMVKTIRIARLKYILSKFNLSSNRLNTIETSQDNVIMSTILSESWMSGMIGSLHGKGPIPWVMTLRPDNSDEFLFVRKVKRSDVNPNPIIEGDELIWTKSEVNERLSKGVTVGSTPNKNLNGYKAFKFPESWIIGKGTESKSWEDIKRVSLEYPKITGFSARVDKYSYSLNPDLDGYGSESQLIEMAKIFDEQEFARATALLFSDFCEIKFPSFSKDGGGIKLKVTMYDIGAFQIMHNLCKLFPSIISVKTLVTFDIKDRVGLLFLREMMVSVLSTLRLDGDTTGSWACIYDRKRRHLFSHQKKAISALESNFKAGKRGSFVWLTVGSGKSLIILSFIKKLIEMGKMCKYAIYTLPSGALQSLASEISMMGFKVILLSPVQRKANEIKDYEGNIIRSIKDASQIEPHTITIVSHDHMRMVSDSVTHLMTNCYFIIDEAHKAIADTLRTSSMLNCALLSYSFCAMTGTPTLDGNTSSLVPWLRMISDSPITPRNHLVAINTMISDCVNVGVKVEESEVNIEIEESEEYLKMLPRKLGGSNDTFCMSDLRECLDICYGICDIKMIDDAISMKNLGVFLVARDNSHQDRLSALLRERGHDSFSITNTRSINLSDDTVKDGGDDYKFVITTSRRSEGYTLTRLSVMMWAPYFSNQATRTQMMGRICRIGQKADHVKYIVYMCGLLVDVHKRHTFAKNVEQMLSHLVD